MFSLIGVAICCCEFLQLLVVKSYLLALGILLFILVCYCYSAAMNPQRLERIRKRREEDDEEFMSLVVPILHYHQMGSRGQMERMQRHSSVLYGKKRVDGIPNC
jgi:hypothetical protein